MSARAVPAKGMDDARESANDRFKRHFGSWLWGSMIVAVVLHLLAFVYWPDMTVQDVSFNASEIRAIELPPEVRIPEAPQAIPRPATPVIADVAVSEDITIGSTSFEDNPITSLPPPVQTRKQEERDLESAPTFTPYTVAPEITNRAEVARALEREYPPLLRDAGIGGAVRVYFFIDESGVVKQKRIDQSSGYAQLDQAAMAVADLMRFTPALNRDKKVPVWVSLPIFFQVKGGR